MHDRWHKSITAILLGPAILLLAVRLSMADDKGFGTHRLNLEFGADIYFGVFSEPNTNFGLGRIDLRSLENTGDPTWVEGSTIISLDGQYMTDGAGTFYGGVAGFANFQHGDGDAAGSTRGDEKSIALERGFAGWRSGSLFASTLGKDAIDFSIGRQDFLVGRQFLIHEGQFEAFDEGNWYWNTRIAFDKTAILRLNIDRFHGDLFYIASTDPEWSKAEFFGANLEYTVEDFGTLAAMYLGFTDHELGNVFALPRDGMDVVNLRLADIKIPGVDNLRFWAEYVKEFGHGGGFEYDSDAYYLEGAYTFAKWPWRPIVSYRYSYFSGDGDPFDTNVKAFDPLFYGVDPDTTSGIGTWIQGEVVGVYYLAHSNQISHFLQVAAWPRDDLNIGANYLHFELDKKNFLGIPVSDKTFADELDVFVNWFPTDSIYVAAIYGVAFPGRAAVEAIGSDDPQHTIRLLFAYSLRSALVGKGRVSPGRRRQSIVPSIK